MNIFFKKSWLIIIFTFILGIIFFNFAQADLTSTNFVLENPVNIIEGGQSSSTSFQYLSSTGQLTSGQSTSSNFTQNAGLLYFPTATSPIVSATAGDTQVSLSWTSAVGIFANITSYDVGVSTISGSGYTFTSVGNVLTHTKTLLTNGTPYFFKVRSFAAGLLLSESAEVSATPVASTPLSTSSGGGGGGGGNPSANSNAIVFSGRAYPNSTVVLLKDAQVLVSTEAGDDANFTISLNSLTAGSYIFSVYSEDIQGNRSSLLTFPISITSGSGTSIGGIFLAPTISADKTTVKKGDNITFFGQSVPKSQITIAIHSAQPIFQQTNTDNEGVYLQVINSSPLDLGNHTAMSKAARDGQISSDSKVVSFAVGDTNIALEKQISAPTRVDLNNDNKTNLIEFSIAAYWYKKTNPPAKVDLNNDGVVNLVDFSIMAYYWTG
jgi:hypothetical protein